ncbi:MAG: uroporphyrinogen-III synthase [Chloroflexota bacterium]
MTTLTGKRIVVTRSREQAPALCHQFEELGATAVSFPVIQFVPIPQTLKPLELYDWILFTSINAVKFFQLTVGNRQKVSINATSVGAVGSATLKALENANISVDFVPDTFTGSALANGLGDINGKRILLPRAKIGRPEIVKMLLEQGALVDDVPLYDTITAVPSTEEWQNLNAGFDAITFTSPSSVRNFIKITKPKADALLNPVSLMQKIVSCIGPSTKAEAQKFDLSVQVMPSKYTIEGLVTAVATYFKEVEMSRVNSEMNDKTTMTPTHSDVLIN